MISVFILIFWVLEVATLRAQCTSLQKTLGEIQGKISPLISAPVQVSSQKKETSKPADNDDDDDDVDLFGSDSDEVILAVFLL